MFLGSRVLIKKEFLLMNSNQWGAMLLQHVTNCTEGKFPHRKKRKKEKKKGIVK